MDNGMTPVTDPSILEELNRSGVSGNLLDAVKHVESRGNPNAVSPAGAVGPYQFMPGTAKQMGVTNPRDEAQARAGAEKYLTQLESKYGGDTDRALLAYNWGPGNVDAWLKTGKGVKGQEIPDEAKQYVAKVRGAEGKQSAPTAPKMTPVTDPALLAQLEGTPTALPKAAARPSTVGGYISDTISNIPSSGGRLISDVASAVMHPIDTFKGVTGALEGGVRKLLPKSIQDMSTRTPEEIARNEKLANAVGDMYKERYGGGQNIADTIRTDPVGVVGDLSVLLGGGGAALKVAPTGSKVARAGAAISDLGTTIDPVVAALRAGNKVVGATGTAAKSLYSTASNIDKSNLDQAYLAGKSGDTTFAEHMRGKKPSSDTVALAKEGVDTMRQTMRDNYANAKGGWANDTTTLNFAPIDASLNRVTNSLQHQGRWKIGEAEQRVVRDLESVIAEWRADPSLHTVDGLDALKQRVSAIYPESPMHTQAQRAVTTVQNEIKSAITNQAPAYKAAMEDYWSRIGELNEIEKTLSLGDKASIDTAVRKLQSVRGPQNMRRAELLDKIETAGGVKIKPALAGQALSETLPRLRGLGGVGMGALMGAGLTGNPMLVGLAGLSSPRLAGEIAHASGKVAGSRVGRTVSAVGGKLPTVTRAGSYATPLSEQRVNSQLKALRQRNR
jgi:hypothetical protein